jgi:hypothetical protein
MSRVHDRLKVLVADTQLAPLPKGFTWSVLVESNGSFCDEHWVYTSAIITSLHSQPEKYFKIRSLYANDLFRFKLKHSQPNNRKGASRQLSCTYVTWKSKALAYIRSSSVFGIKSSFKQS